jgi:hypothetical protein
MLLVTLSTLTDSTSWTPDTLIKERGYPAQIIWVVVAGIFLMYLRIFISVKARISDQIKSKIQCGFYRHSFKVFGLCDEFNISLWEIGILLIPVI